MIVLFLTAVFAAGTELPQAPGMHEEVFRCADGSVLRYTLSIPKGYDSSRPRPLVLALHYGGEFTPYYGGGFLRQLVEPGLRKLDAILVAPDCPSRDWANPTSEGKVMALIEQVLESYAVDRKRVLVTGYSLGGRGTWYMASRHPDLFTAAIPMAGWPSDEMVEKIGNMPLCIIHSEDDEVVSMEPTQNAIRTLEARGVPVELITLHGVTHYQVPGFTKYLEKAARWVKDQWEK